MVYSEPAYAKLNLSLDILGRRDDGYHDLRMVMQSIDLADTVTAVPCPEPGFHISSTLPYLPKGENNIAAKAAACFFDQAGLSPIGLDIDIQKHIPVCAGMAGGSTDGAAVLRILRRSFVPDMPDSRLEEIGALVGSDVPYCVRGGSALAEGRGELLTDLAPLPPCWFVVCKPPCTVSTPELFGLVKVRHLRYHPRTDELVTALKRGDLDGIAQRLYNVFEDVLPRRYAVVFEIKRRLLDLGAMVSSMTGSGPTVFGIFRDRGTAENGFEALKQQFKTTFLCKAVERAV